MKFSVFTVIMQEFSRPEVVKHLSSSLNRISLSILQRVKLMAEVLIHRRICLTKFQN